MKKGTTYLVRAILSAVVLSRTLPAVDNMESAWRGVEDNPLSGMGVAMWLLALLISLIVAVVMIQNIFRFIAEIKKEKNVGDESAMETMEVTLKRIQLIMTTFFQALFGLIFVGIGCFVIFAPKEMTGGESLAPAGSVFVVLGGLWTGIAVWKAMKKWKADKNTENDSE